MQYTHCNVLEGREEATILAKSQRMEKETPLGF